MKTSDLAGQTAPGCATITVYPTRTRMATSPLLKKAIKLGWQITKGAKHYKLYHPLTGQTTILPYGSKRSDRSERNIQLRLKVVYPHGNTEKADGFS